MSDFFLPIINSEWSSLEKEMGDDLQKSGHYMDRSAAGFDYTIILIEEIFYLFLAQGCWSSCLFQIVKI